MSALEVTWSKDWDVAQVDSKEPLPSTLVADSVNASTNSLGAIENLWFFSDNKTTNTNSDTKEENEIESLSPLEVNIHCSLSSTTSSIHILCSAKFIEIFTFICEPKTENILKSSYMKTSRGQFSSSFPSWEHLYLHEVVLPPITSTSVDGIQLKFLSLNLSLPLPGSLLSQEPQLCDNQRYRIIQVAKIELHGMKSTSCENTTSLPTNEQHYNASSLPPTPSSLAPTPPKDMMLAIMMAAMTSRQQHTASVSPFPSTPLSVASVSHSSLPPIATSQTFDKQADYKVRDNSNNEVFSVSNSITMSNNGSNIKSGGSHRNNNVANNLVPQDMPLLQIQQMLQQMQHQLLSQLSQQITLACQPLNQRMQQLEAKLDHLSFTIAKNYNHNSKKEDKDNSPANNVMDNIINNCDSI